METYNIIVIIVIVILLVWVLSPSTKSSCLNKLNGFWVADDDFCQNSGIELMTVFFGDYDSSEMKKNYKTYLCWILIVNDAGQFNHITTVDIDLANVHHVKDSQYEFDVEFQDIPDDIFPTSLKIQIVPGELITLINPDDDSKVFEGTKNEDASKAIEFNIT